MWPSIVTLCTTAIIGKQAKILSYILMSVWNRRKKIYYGSMALSATAVEYE